jgi:hypothetical protein
MSRFVHKFSWNLKKRTIFISGMYIKKNSINKKNEHPKLIFSFLSHSVYQKIIHWYFPSPHLLFLFENIKTSGWCIVIYHHSHHTSHNSADFVILKYGSCLEDVMELETRYTDVPKLLKTKHLDFKILENMYDFFFVGSNLVKDFDLSLYFSLQKIFKYLTNWQIFQEI